MNLSTIDIERVVREVLAELSAACSSSAQYSDTSTPQRPATAVAGSIGGASCTVCSDASASKRPATAVAGSVGADSKAPPGPQSRGVDSGSNGELLVNAPVVTMLDVSGRLDGVRRVLVPPKAIVTPAVRDELIRRGISLANADSPSGRAVATLRLALTTTGTDFDPGALVAGLTRDGCKVEHTALDCLIAATEQLAADPRAGTFFQLKQTVTEFCRGGVRSCPAVFRAKLA
jgi:hypothetical protein